MSRPRAVVFDLDGLMFNTEELYRDVGSELLGRRGKQYTPDLIDAMMGRPARVALRTMIEWHNLEDTVEQLACEVEQIFTGILAARLAPMPGLTELMLALERAELPKAIGTSSNRKYVDNVLARFDFHDRFAFILTADDVQQGKPDPEVYLKAAQKFGVTPADMLVLEDSQTGCRAAVAAGAIAVAVPGEHSRRHDFSGASLVAQGLMDPRLYELLRIEAIADAT